MLHSYVTDMAARMMPTIQIPNFLGSMGEIGADIAVESWLFEIWPCLGAGT